MVATQRGWMGRSPRPAGEAEYLNVQWLDEILANFEEDCDKLGLYGTSLDIRKSGARSTVKTDLTQPCFGWNEFAFIFFYGDA